MSATRPFVVVHMISSVDGRLRSAGWSLPVNGNKQDRAAVYQKIHERLEGDAWMCGRVTMTEFFTGKAHPPADAGTPARPVFAAERNAPSYAIALDPKGQLHRAPGDLSDEHPIVLLGRQVPDSHLAELAKDGVSYIVSESETVDLGKMIEVLKREFGIERLLVEGGGVLVGSMLAAGLVDEFSLLIYPGVFGKTGEPTIVESGAEGVGGKVKFATIGHELMDGGIMWLRYAVSSA
jgi:riboflavin biosynthesis pyrimidine reductase